MMESGGPLGEFARGNCFLFFFDETSNEEGKAGRVGGNRTLTKRRPHGDSKRNKMDDDTIGRLGNGKDLCIYMESYKMASAKTVGFKSPWHFPPREHFPSIAIVRPMANANYLQPFAHWGQNAVTAYVQGVTGICRTWLVGFR